MSTYQFQFSSASELYVKHLAVIREMRAETYRNIAEFGNVLLKLLSGKEGLAHKETNPAGSFAGGKIHYLWIETDPEKQKKRKVLEVGMVSFAFPIPNKVEDSNDATWETYWAHLILSVRIVLKFGSDIKVPIYEQNNESWS
jgi:hypothetical protein